MNTKNFILRCKDLAAKNKDGLLKYRSYALIAIGIVTIAMLALGAYWFAHANGESKGVDGSADVSPSSSNQYQTTANAADPGVTPEYDYSEAPKHIGERATVRGTVEKIFTAKSGVTFFDFCQGFDACPFGAVVFASDLKSFGDLKRYQRAVKLYGVIKSYQGKAEMVLNGPDQIE